MTKFTSTPLFSHVKNKIKHKIFIQLRWLQKLHWKRNPYSVICALIKLFCTITWCCIDEKENHTWAGGTQIWGGGPHPNLHSEKIQNLSSLKYILHLKNHCYPTLVRKHVLSELQSLIATIAALYHMRQKITITIKRGDFNPKPRTFLHGGKVQTARTRLRAPVEMSDKYRQLLNRGQRCCVCLHKSNSTARLTGVRSTRFGIVGLQ